MFPLPSSKLVEKKLPPVPSLIRNGEDDVYPKGPLNVLSDATGILSLSPLNSFRLLQSYRRSLLPPLTFQSVEHVPPAEEHSSYLWSCFE